MKLIRTFPALLAQPIISRLVRAKAR